MRITLGLLLLAGCAGTPSGSNAIADQVPPPSAPRVPVPQSPGVDPYLAAIAANEAPFGEPGIGTAELGQEIRMDIASIRPLEVVEDSRCPVDATCVWAGRVRVRVRVTIGNAAIEPVMEVNRPVTLSSSQQLTLVAVAPLNWTRPPAGVDPRAPKRFAFTLID